MSERHRPLAVVVGFIGKLPYAGMSLFNLHYIAGLQALGYDVHYVERMNRSGECYDPSKRAPTDDPAVAVGYLAQMMPRFGVDPGHVSFIDLDNVCHGTTWAGLNHALNRADFILTLADPTWFDELEQCPRRAFVDGDPMFTQVALADPGGTLAGVVDHYTTLFTYGTRMGLDDCAVPDVGRTWISTRPVVATSLWTHTLGDPDEAVTGLMHWASGIPIVWNGRTYGHKDVSFEPFMELPARCGQRLALAVGGRRAPRDRMTSAGWILLNPLEATDTIDHYRAFIAGASADFGVAKDAYVASRSGWFSDRSTCFLAAGRPVLHQDTGFGDWLPSGHGVLPFSDLDDCLEALRWLRTDYAQHTQAARRVAEEHFEASTVVGLMLEAAGLQ